MYSPHKQLMRSFRACHCFSWAYGGLKAGRTWRDGSCSWLPWCTQYGGQLGSLASPAGPAPPPGPGSLRTPAGRGSFPLRLQLRLPAEGGGLLEEPVWLAQASGNPEQIPSFPHHHRRWGGHCVSSGSTWLPGPTQDASLADTSCPHFALASGTWDAAGSPALMASVRW